MFRKESRGGSLDTQLPKGVIVTDSNEEWGFWVRQLDWLWPAFEPSGGASNAMRVEIIKHVAAAAASRKKGPTDDGDGDGDGGGDGAAQGELPRCCCLCACICVCVSWYLLLAHPSTEPTSMGNCRYLAPFSFWPER